VHYRYYCHFAGLQIIPLTETVEGLPSQGRGDGTVFKIASFSLKTELEQKTGNVVISEVDSLMYVAQCKAEKHVSYGILVGTMERIVL
jgi:hypothetical protein